VRLREDGLGMSASDEITGDRSFERFAALCAIAAGALGVGYSIAFVLFLRESTRGAAYANSTLLLAGGLLTIAVFVAVYGRLRTTDPGLALWGLAFALVGSFGAAMHGAYDLANLVNPPESLAGDVPNAVDPRGLATFGLTGIGVAAAGVLIVRGRRLPVRLGYLAFLSAALLVYVYIGRLVILNPKSPGLLAAAVLVGFVVNPAFFIWLGLVLWSGRRFEAESRRP
jgi:hypothetical protein